MAVDDFLYDFVANSSTLGVRVDLVNHMSQSLHENSTYCIHRYKKGCDQVSADVVLNNLGNMDSEVKYIVCFINIPPR